MVRFARLPWPNTFMPLFMPMARVPGPLQTITGPTGMVVANTPWMLKVSLHTASTPAITHGRYSGLQPAITALMAIFSTVTSTRSGGTTATTSEGARVVPCSMRMTRCSVGGTTGSPSVQPRSNMASNSSSRSATSTRRALSTEPPKRTRNLSTRSGSTLSEPQPGRNAGRSGPSPDTAVTRSHSSRTQPTVRSTSTPFDTRITVGTVSMSWCQLTERSASWTTSIPSGKAGSSCTYRLTTVPDSRSCAMTGTTMRHVSHSRFTTITRPSGRTGTVEWFAVMSLAEEFHDDVVHVVGTFQMQEVPGTVHELGARGGRKFGGGETRHLRSHAPVGDTVQIQQRL